MCYLLVKAEERTYCLRRVCNPCRYPLRFSKECLALSSINSYCRDFLFKSLAVRLLAGVSKPVSPSPATLRRARIKPLVAARRATPRVSSAQKACRSLKDISIYPRMRDELLVVQDGALPEQRNCKQGQDEAEAARSGSAFPISGAENEAGCSRSLPCSHAPSAVIPHSRDISLEHRQGHVYHETLAIPYLSLCQPPLLLAAESAAPTSESGVASLIARENARCIRAGLDLLRCCPG